MHDRALLPWAKQMAPMSETGALPHERIKSLIVPGFSPLADPSVKGWRKRTGLPETRMSSPPHYKKTDKPDSGSKDAVAPVVVIATVLAVGYYLLVK